MDQDSALEYVYVSMYAQRSAHTSMRVTYKYFNFSDYQLTHEHIETNSRNICRRADTSNSNTHGVKIHSNNTGAA